MHEIDVTISEHSSIYRHSGDRYQHSDSEPDSKNRQHHSDSESDSDGGSSKITLGHVEGKSASDCIHGTTPVFVRKIDYGKTWVEKDDADGECVLMSVCGGKGRGMFLDILPYVLLSISYVYYVCMHMYMVWGKVGETKYSRGCEPF